MGKRSIRRHHGERMKDKARRIFHDFWHWDADEYYIGLFADNLRYCSRACCTRGDCATRRIEAKSPKIEEFDI